jgi:hypothetical protein
MVDGYFSADLVSKNFDFIEIEKICPKLHQFKDTPYCVKSLLNVYLPTWLIEFLNDQWTKVLLLQNSFISITPKKIFLG